MAVLTIVSGPPGSGKSTSCQELARAVERGLHINADFLYNMVQGGYRQPWEPGAEILRGLMFRVAGAQTEIYLAEGFDVFIDYVFEKQDLARFLAAIQDKELPARLVFLFPAVDTVVSRDGAREHVVGAERVRSYHERFAKIRERVPEFFFDNTQKKLVAGELVSPISVRKLEERLQIL